MGRLRTETIKIDPTLLHRTPASAELTPAILADYSARMRAQRRREDSMRSCEKVLRQFYDFLPESKTVTRDTLEKWRDQLLAENYAIRTVNSKVSMVNALLESMDCRDFQVTRQLLPEEFEAPELTRQEYVRMLQTARTLEDERAYVLTKLFATTGKAARNLTKRTGLPARTVHSALGVHPDEDFLSPVVWNTTELVVVDEASMMTLEMLAGILHRVCKTCRVVLLGDPNQLLSVGSGNVLPDLLALGIPCARLRHVAGTQWGNKKYMNMKHLEAALEDVSIAG